MILSGFLIGIFGSFHCVGMCGPIALGLPGKGRAGWKFIWGRILYNLGRITTYSVLGAIAGLLGVGARMFQVQQAFSIVLGILLLLWGISEITGTRLPAKWNLAGKLGTVVRQQFKHWFGKGDSKSLYMIGVLNGMLPCGLVWLALISAALTTQPLAGAALMAMFGLGTFPLMFALGWGGKFATAKFRSRVNRLLPYTVVVFGILFMLRGMNLGIPYVSPTLDHQMGSGDAVTVSCCHKK